MGGHSKSTGGLSLVCLEQEQVCIRRGRLHLLMANLKPIPTGNRFVHHNPYESFPTTVMLKKHNQSASAGNCDGSSHQNEESSIEKGEDEYYDPASYLEAEGANQGGTIDTRGYPLDLMGMPIH